MIYSWKSRVLRIEERMTRRFVGGFSLNAEFKDISTGWWIVTDDYVAHCIGNEKPNCKVGDIVKRSMEIG